MAVLCAVETRLQSWLWAWMGRVVVTVTHFWAVDDVSEPRQFTFAVSRFRPRDSYVEVCGAKLYSRSRRYSFEYSPSRLSPVKWGSFNEADNVLGGEVLFTKGSLGLGLEVSAGLPLFLLGSGWKTFQMLLSDSIIVLRGGVWWDEWWLYGLYRARVGYRWWLSEKLSL